MPTERPSGHSGTERPSRIRTRTFHPMAVTMLTATLMSSGPAVTRFGVTKRVIGYTPESSDTVVEIECGVGRLTRVIAAEVGRVIALDISEKMLAIARQANLPNVDFRVAQGFALPGIQDKWVDLSLGYCVFQHLPSRTALKSYLSEMHRVTKAGEMVAFTLTPRDWRTWLLPLCALELTCENAYRAKAQKVSTGKNG